MRAILLCLALVLGGCCGGPALDMLISVEIGAQTADLKKWNTLSDAQKKQSAEQSLEFAEEMKFRLE